MADVIKIYQKLKQDLTQLVAWVRANFLGKVQNPTAGHFAGVDSNGNVVDSGYGSSSFQTPLASQTAYSQKGSASAVPQITTNSLGQVTGITEVPIDIPASQVQTDWQENDPTSVRHIQNRTHYIESVSTSDVWYQSNVEVGSGSSSPGAYSGTFTLTTGKTYNVTITQGSNTKTYEGIVAENNTTLNGLFLNKNWSNPMYGAETASDAFYILVQASSVILASVDVYGSGCTVQISEVTETIHKLDPKYLPDNVNQLDSITTSKSGKVTTVTFEQTNGTETQFQVTDGEDGKSAYQVAVDNGYSGTEAQWLASLKGADGVDLGQAAVVQTTGNSQTDLMSQKAVTDAILSIDKRLPESFYGNFATWNIADYPNFNIIASRKIGVIFDRKYRVASVTPDISVLLTIKSSDGRDSIVIDVINWQIRLLMKKDNVSYTKIIPKNNTNSDFLHYIVCLDFDNGETTMYRDGSYISTNGFDTSKIPDLTKLSTIIIGNTNINGKYGVAVLNTVVDADQASEIYNLYPQRLVPQKYESNAFVPTIISFTSGVQVWPNTVSYQGATSNSITVTTEDTLSQGRLGNSNYFDKTTDLPTMKVYNHRIVIPLTVNSGTLHIRTIGMDNYALLNGKIYNSLGTLLGTVDGSTANIVTVGVGSYTIIAEGVVPSNITLNNFFLTFGTTGATSFTISNMTKQRIGCPLIFEPSTYRGSYWQMPNGTLVSDPSLTVYNDIYKQKVSTLNYPQYNGQLRMDNGNIYIGYMNGGSAGTWKQINNS